MSRAIQRNIEGADWRVWPDEVQRLGWSEIFALPRGAPLRLHVDIGFGDGNFLCELARRDPTRAFVGIERSFKRVLKAARRLARSELHNVRLFGVDAAWAVREAFDDESVESFSINFPDPWPKRRHRRRRLLEPGFVSELARRLAVGGSLQIATDDPDYAQQIRLALALEPLLENEHAPVPHVGARPELPPTRFQLAWAAEGRACFFFHHRRAKAIATSGSGVAARAASGRAARS
ncbi:MAG TPA: tRNA (guanosine(46)-N7)-methyltransferase TrmB [Myxococcota bacterium]|nr:tRNA (guanosine(46)-N7)-methyltransferase TrmB [Myxococcota bacterium]